MFDKLLKYFDAWLHRWQLWVFSPRELYPRGKNAISSFAFFVGNTLLAYGAIAIVTFGFLVIEHRREVQVRIATKAGEVLTVATGFFVAYVAATLVAYLLASLISFKSFRFAGTKAEYRDHFKCFLELTFLEPLFIAAVGLALLMVPPTLLRQNYNEFNLIIVVFVLLRAWSLGASYFALRNIHALPARRFRIAFFTGHLISFIVLAVLGTLIGWILLVAFVGGWE